MAKARFISKSIARDECVAQLTAESQLLFARAIPFADNAGRIPGEPGAVRQLAVPLLPWSDDQVDALIAEWERTSKPGGVPSPLVIRYPLQAPCRWRDRELGVEFECRLALAFRGFAKHQPKRLRRGAPSSLPDPPRLVGQWATCTGGPVAHNASGPDQAQPLRACARGLGSHPREGSSGGASKLAAADPAAGKEQIDWLAGEAERLFGRRMVPLRPVQVAAACAAIDRLGRDRAAAVIAEKAAAGLDPKSLAYFMPALEDAAAAAATRLRADAPTFARTPAGGGFRTGDLIDLSHRLKEERLASG